MLHQVLYNCLESVVCRLDCHISLQISGYNRHADCAVPDLVRPIRCRETSSSSVIRIYETQLSNEYVDHARLIVDEDKHIIVGATFTGLQVSDLLHSATVAIVSRVPIHRLWHAVPSFPTISELWIGLLKNYYLHCA